MKNLRGLQIFSSILSLFAVMLGAGLQGNPGYRSIFPRIDRNSFPHVTGQCRVRFRRGDLVCHIGPHRHECAADGQAVLRHHWPARCSQINPTCRKRLK